MVERQTEDLEALGSIPREFSDFFCVSRRTLRTQNLTGYPPSRSDLRLDAYSIREVRLKLGLLDPVAHKISGLLLYEDVKKITCRV